ncbi:hypothetical protein TeGR_g6525 [Tetraparma gracilis]|uniref:phosphatidate cytidylyltransferase n=1 Tax=Tetraparma gracilis TaxID=2962635 RepID=A0ABQ6MDB9_9STRA|nr:hypothetical protein TeGR_g6525 [Tetraparma gracilis]
MPATRGRSKTPARSPSPAKARSKTPSRSASKPKKATPAKKATPKKATPKKATPAKKAVKADDAEPTKMVGGTRAAMTGAAVAKDESKASKIFTRVFWGVIMVLGFLGVMFSGHVWICGLVFMLEVRLFQELVKVRYNTHIDTIEKKVPLFRTLQWLWFSAAMFYCYSDFVLEVLKDRKENHDAILDTYTNSILGLGQFGLYASVFVLTVVTLQKEEIKFQLNQLTWTICVICLTVGQLKYIMHNLFNGMIWFTFPVLLVVVNDIMAYVFGMSCGKKFIKSTFLKISPNKTWEGFIGGGISTIFIGWFLAGFLTKFSWMTCPGTLELWSAPLECETDMLYVESTFTIPSSFTFSSEDVQITVLPFQLHSIPLSLFASVMAPFGGFLASGIKRAYKIKDFDSFIPGHGGIMDRMDCQFLMALCTWVHYNAFVKMATVSVAKMLFFYKMLPAGDQAKFVEELAALTSNDESRSERGSSERGASERTPPAASITFRDHSRESGELSPLTRQPSDPPPPPSMVPASRFADNPRSRFADAAPSPPASLKRAASDEVAKDSKRSRDSDSEVARVVAEKDAERAEARIKKLTAENNALRERAFQAERDAVAARQEQLQAEQASASLTTDLFDVTRQLKEANQQVKPALRASRAVHISTYLVTNGQHPDAIDTLIPVTQLYVSVDAPTPQSLEAIDRPLFKDAWDRLKRSLTLVRKKRQRTVARLTVVKGWNSDEIDGYADLIALGQVSFVEVKGVTFCGTSDASNLNMSNSPWHHEVVEFTEKLRKRLQNLTERGGPDPPPLYGLACEHKHSCSVLLARIDQFAYTKENGERGWNTWIDYEKFDQLAKAYKANGTMFEIKDYVLPCPHWAEAGAVEEGFDPTDLRHRRKGKSPLYTKFDLQGIPTHGWDGIVLAPEKRKELEEEMAAAMAKFDVEKAVAENEKAFDQDAVDTLGGVVGKGEGARKGERVVKDPRLMYRGLVKG